MHYLFSDKIILIWWGMITRPRVSSAASARSQENRIGRSPEGTAR